MGKAVQGLGYNEVSIYIFFRLWNVRVLLQNDISRSNKYRRKREQVHHDMISDCWKEAVWKYNTLAKWIQITSMIIQLVTHKHLFCAKDLSLICQWWTYCLWLESAGLDHTHFIVTLMNKTIHTINTHSLLCIVEKTWKSFSFFVKRVFFLGPSWQSATMIYTRQKLYSLEHTACPMQTRHILCECTSY